MSKFSLIFLSSFLVITSLFSFLNIIYSYYFNLYLNANSYLYSLITSIILIIFFYLFKKEGSKITIYSKILTVLSGYIIIPLIISLPYYFSIYNLSFINCIFESISGFTSTGFTIFNNIKHLDESLILWRSTSQWIGGLYFLFSIIILIDIFDDNLKKSLTNFLSFNSDEAIKQATKVLILYICLTISIFIILKFIDFRNFDAFNFSLSVISSGGFKPLNQINYILDQDYKVILFSLTLLISFFSIFLSYNLFFIKNRQFNFFTEDLYLLFYLISLILLFFIFFGENFSSLLLSITTSVSNVGIYFDKKENELFFIYLILVIIGGSFFSTSSGIRFYKIITLLRFSINELLSHSKPKQVMVNKVFFDDNKIDYNIINKYFLTIIIFILSLTTISSLISSSGYSFSTSLKLGILTIMNTVNSSLYGLSNFEFESINYFTKLILIIFMIIGRVELITIIILFKKYLFKN